MNDPTQASPGAGPAETSPPADAPPGAGAPAFGAAGIQRGLWLWMGILAVGGVACTLLGHVEGALLFAGAGAFALAQASDAAATFERYRLFVDTELPPGSVHGAVVRWLTGALVPLAGAALYAAFCLYAWRGAADRPLPFAAWWCAGAVAACLLLTPRRVADALARLMFRGEPARTRRLTARIVVMLLLMPAPALQIMPPLIASMAESGTPLADAPGLVAQLLGELAVAFAGVGLFVRRDWRQVLERLGLTGMRPWHWAVAIGGVLAAVALNGCTDWIEHHLFPALWQQDSDTTRLIASHMPLATSLLLGVCAGTGEEIAVRGALQPRLGIPLSALVFASAHVQYTWFGMLTVGLLGVLLGLIRARTNTTTVVVVHAIYDIYAVVTAF